MCPIKWAGTSHRRYRSHSGRTFLEPNVPVESGLFLPSGSSAMFTNHRVCCSMQPCYFIRVCRIPWYYESNFSTDTAWIDVSSRSFPIEKGGYFRNCSRNPRARKPWLKSYSPGVSHTLHYSNSLPLGQDHSRPLRQGGRQHWIMNQFLTIPPNVSGMIYIIDKRN